MMSSIMSKTLNYAVDRFQGREVTQTIDTDEFMKILTAPKSQQNSVENICKILSLIKDDFESCSDHQKRKYLCAIIYCCQVYRDAKISNVLSQFFTLIVANMKRSTSIASKRISYTALVSIIECNNNELIYLSVNTILMDISSKDVSVIRLSLLVAAQIITVDLIPVLLPIVERRIVHSDVNVRIKAYQVLHCMYRVAPEFIHNTKVHITKGLTDKNPRVMTAAIPYIYDIIKKNSSQHSDISSKMIFILHQISKGNLPPGMNRHGIPAPWLIIQILKIVMLLEVEEDHKKKLEDVLMEVMNRSQLSKQMISFAVLSECIHTTVVLFCEEDPLFKMSEDILPLFLQNLQPNIMLAGLELLTQLSKINVKYCSRYQDLIINCLEHNDITIKRQTLVLLESLVNENNYKIVIDQMIKHLQKNDKYFVKNFSKKITIVVEKFSRDIDWILSTFHTILNQAGENISEIVSQRIFAVLNQATNEIKNLEVKRCLNLMKNPLLPTHFQLLLSIVSEYCQTSDADFDSIIESFLAQYSQQKVKDNEMSLTLILAITRLCSILPCDNKVMDKILNTIDPYSTPTIYQSVSELHALLENKTVSDTLKNINYKNFEFDKDMSFLESFVNQSKQEQSDNIQEDEDQEEEEELVVVEKSDFKFQPYEANFNQRGVVKNKEQFLASVMHDNSGDKSTPEKVPPSFLSRKVETKTEVVWGKEGYLKGKSSDLTPSKVSTIVKTEPDEDKVKLSQALFGDIASPSVQGNTAHHRPSLNQALLNLSAVAKTSQEDHEILDAMNNMIMTSQSGSDVTAHDSE